MVVTFAPYYFRRGGRSFWKWRTYASLGWCWKFRQLRIQFVVLRRCWKIAGPRGSITMVSSNLATRTHGHCYVTLSHKNSNYSTFNLSVLSSLCAHVFLGSSFLCLHKMLVLPVKSGNDSVSRFCYPIFYLTALLLLPDLDGIPSQMSVLLERQSTIWWKNKSPNHPTHLGVLRYC